MTLLLPHVDDTPTGRTKSDAYLIEHLTTIDAIEGLTGIDFLTDANEMPQAKEDAIEGFRAMALWPRE